MSHFEHHRDGVYWVDDLYCYTLVTEMTATDWREALGKDDGAFWARPLSTQELMER